MNRYGFYLAVFSCCCLGGMGGAWAAGPQRAQNWEGGFQVLRTGSENVDGSKGSSVDMDSAFGLGFDFNYNLDQNVALGFAMTWSRPDYDATFYPSIAHSRGIIMRVSLHKISYSLILLTFPSAFK